MDRATRFLFHPVIPARRDFFRILFALFLAASLWSMGKFPTPEIPCDAFWNSAYETVFLSRWYGIFCLLFLITWVAGRYPRCSAALLLALLFPLIFVEGRAVSRQILWFSLLAFSMYDFMHSRSDASPIWPIRLIQLQVTLAYLVNALAKSNPDFLGGGILMGMSRELDNFHVDLASGVVPLGPFGIPVAWAAMGTVLMEYFLSVAFWVPGLRWAAAAAGVLFHFALKSFLTIGMLDWTCMFLYTAFLIPFAQSTGKDFSSSPSGPSPRRSGYGRAGGRGLR